MKCNHKFWNFEEGEQERKLYISGVIIDDGDFGEENDTTPNNFKNELLSSEGDITVWIHSLGGDLLASSQIYNLLKDYKGKVTVKIDGIAASAASMIAMAGDEVLMSPVSTLMLHDPITSAFGNTKDMTKAIEMLDELKESIINAYQIKTNLSRSKISHMMDEETWLNANKAVELGFADGILFKEENQNVEQINQEPLMFHRKSMNQQILMKLQKTNKKIHIESLFKRLNLLKRR